MSARPTVQDNKEDGRTRANGPQFYTTDEVLLSLRSF